MRTVIYVDGFNLYHGSLKGTAYKWLDLSALFSGILADHHSVEAIKYFTARLQAPPRDPSQHLRQKAYLKALRSIPHLECHYGNFSTHKVRMKNASPPPNTVEVIKTEEKGSDVNLAVHLLNDAWKDRFDCGVVVSNDSDLAESMALVRREFPKKKLGLFHPAERPTAKLKRYANFHRKITVTHLAAAQFPTRVSDPVSGSVINKPSSW